MPRELGTFPPAVVQHLIRLPRDRLWEILEALQKLCDDPLLLGLQEEDDQGFIVVVRYAVFVEVGDRVVNVLALRKIGAT